MELLANSVANEGTNHTHLILFCSCFNGFANVAQWAAWHNSFNSTPNAFLSNGNEVAIFFINFTNCKCCIGVAMHAIHVTRDVEVNDVAVLQHARIGNAMANHFVHRSAHTLWVTRIIQWTRVRAALNAQVVHIHINFIGGDSWTNKLSGKPEYFGSSRTCNAHALDNFRRLHCGFLPTRDLAGLCVRRLHNVFRNSSHWTDGAWLYTTFCCFMATFVLTSTATPARIVSCRQDCGRLSGGWVVHTDKATGKKYAEIYVLDT